MSKDGDRKYIVIRRSKLDHRCGSQYIRVRDSLEEATILAESLAKQDPEIEHVVFVEHASCSAHISDPQWTPEGVS